MSAPVVELYAFVGPNPPGEGPDGNDGEGIVAMLAPGMGSMPMVVASRAVADKLGPVAKLTAKLTGRRIRLVRFLAREEIATFDP